MRSLRPRRHRSRGTWARTRRAVADRENGRITCRLQCRRHDKLIDAIGLEPIELPQHLRRLDPSRPYDELGGNEGAISQPDALRRDVFHFGAGVDLYAHLLEQAVRSLGDMV